MKSKRLPIIGVKIESHIPIPETKVKKQKFPFREMNIGDSFSFPLLYYKIVINNSSNFSKRNPEYKFKVRKEENNERVRIWRVPLDEEC